MKFEFVEQEVGPPMVYLEVGGDRVQLPGVQAIRRTMNREESFVLGNDIVSRELEPAKVRVTFDGGEITLDCPRPGLH